jgi:glycosyltransferase involved in cell wall biosynthesis
MPLYCRRADAIVTVSEWSKRDMVAHYGLDPGKVTVIHEAASPEFVPVPAEAVDEVRRRYGLPEPFLLHVGTIEPRKNLRRLVEALQGLRDAGLSIPLVLTSAKGWLYEGFFRQLEELEVRDSVHLTGYVPASDLPALYSMATATVLASVYEGFGLPVLEAMACGTPVLCSNASSLPEIGGGAARYFDPHDVTAMGEAIRAVWTDAELRADMRQRGLAQAARFSWERAAKETMELYDSMVAVYNP